MNVISQALSLLECLVKNCGEPVHNEVFTKDFLETLVNIAKVLNHVYSPRIYFNIISDLYCSYLYLLVIENQGDTTDTRSRTRYASDVGERECFQGSSWLEDCSANSVLRSQAGRLRALLPATARGHILGGHLRRGERSEVEGSVLLLEVSGHVRVHHSQSTLCLFSPLLTLGSGA